MSYSNNQNNSLSVPKGFTPLEKFGHITQQVVMPIIALADEEVLLLGTGFMIHQDGLMMTAKHVIDKFGAPQVKNFKGGYYKSFSLYTMYISNEKHGPNNEFYNGGLWPIDKAWYGSELDIAFCWLKPAFMNGKRIKFTPTKLSFKLPKIRENILSFGYYKSVAKYVDKEVKKVDVEYSHHTAFSTGNITDIYSPRRDMVMLNFPCFQTSAKINAGMSGSPIFNESGEVCGVVTSAVDQDENGLEYISSGSLLWPTLGMKLEISTDGGSTARWTTVYELVKRGFILSDDQVDKFIKLHELDNKQTVILKKND